MSNKFGLFIVIVLMNILLSSCVGATRGGDGAQNSGKADAEQGNNNDTFIPAVGLTEAEIDELWSHAIDTCFAIKYAVTFNDRKTKNLACQMEDGGTYTARVKFMDNGIFVDVTSPSMAEWATGGYGQKRDRKLMKDALEAKLAEIKGRKK